MNELEKEKKLRNKKILENYLKLIKLQAEIRKKNEEVREKKLGIQETVSKFHKPVVKAIKEQEEVFRKPSKIFLFHHLSHLELFPK